MNGVSLCATLAEYESKREEADAILQNFNDWSQIPLVTDAMSMNAFADGSLARFQGMVQDVLNPEYYLAEYKVRNTSSGTVEIRKGQFLDLLHCKDSEELEESGEANEVRQPLFCIPIPGLNEWTKNCKEVKETTTPASGSSGQKRPLPDDSEMEVDSDAEKKLPPQLTGATVPTASSRSYSNDKYFPLPQEKGLACIVKHYGDRDDYLVNSRIDVIGFLSLSPALEASWQDCDAEDKALHPPPSLVPRLHALRIRKLSHCNPNSSGLPFKGDEVKTIRSDLITVFTQLLLGDTLAAEYLLCNLLSKVYARRDGLSLGTFSLNLFKIQASGYARLFYEFIEMLTPCSVYLPLTIEELNRSSYIPKKDYETNRLLSGKLQLTDDTHLVLDETVMAPGQLNETGIRNISALRSISLLQEIRYDFTYFQLDYHTDIPITIFSEGKSMVPTIVALPLKPEPDTESTLAETFEAARFFLSGSRLDAARNFLTTARQQECDMSNTDYVGPSWVELRQQNERLKEDDLHRLLVLSRILCLSDGRSSVVEDDWKKAVAMETERWSRL